MDLIIYFILLILVVIILKLGNYDSVIKYGIGFTGNLYYILPITLFFVYLLEHYPDIFGLKTHIFDTSISRLILFILVLCYALYLHLSIFNNNHYTTQVYTQSIKIIILYLAIFSLIVYMYMHQWFDAIVLMTVLPVAGVSIGLIH
jgi:hypothetical protein